MTQTPAKSNHDHGLCMADAQTRAAQAFADRGQKFTEQRQAVLHEIASAHQAVGAYEVVERLAQRGIKLAPMAVYRAIEALQETGLVHRLAARNAFFACHVGHAAGRDMLVFACGRCANVTEVDSAAVFGLVDQASLSLGFKRDGHLIEIVGICAACQVPSAGDVALL